MYEVDKYTVSLLHFDDGIKDETGKVWTASGGADVSTTQSKFGGSSLHLDGTAQYLTTQNSADFNFGSGNFTVDWWEYREDGGVYPLTLSISGGKNSYGLLIGHYFKGQNNCYASSNGATWDILNDFSLGSIDYNILNHFAIVRSGNTFYGFKNGILTSKVISSGNIFFVNASCKIGNWDLGVNDYHYCGYIDEFRISSIARWTENFNPEPIKTNNLLRITMSDSSEREYKVSTAEKDNFIKWFNSSDVVVETSSYEFDKDINGSKEYVAYDKIISFETVTNNSQTLLRITMSDSSEREYKVTADMLDTFVKWFNRSNVSVRNTSYLFNKDIDGGKEYLSFDKIISFEVIEIK